MERLKWKIGPAYKIPCNRPFQLCYIKSAFAGYELLAPTKAVNSSVGVLACNDTQIVLCPQVAQNITVGTVLVGVLDSLPTLGASGCTLISRCYFLRAVYAFDLNNAARLLLLSLGSTSLKSGQFERYIGLSTPKCRLRV